VGDPRKEKEREREREREGERERKEVTEREKALVFTFSSTWSCPVWFGLFVVTVKYGLVTPISVSNFDR